MGIIGNVGSAQWVREDVTIAMAGSVPAPEVPQGTANAVGPSTSGRLDAVPVQSPCRFPASRRGEQDALPPLPTQASNLFRAVVAFVGDGCGVVDDAQYRQRLEICRDCDRRTGKRCAACGCRINVKARGRAFRCPLGRWQ